MNKVYYRLDSHGICLDVCKQYEEVCIGSKYCISNCKHSKGFNIEVGYVICDLAKSDFERNIKFSTTLAKKFSFCSSLLIGTALSYMEEFELYEVPVIYIKDQLKELKFSDKKINKAFEFLYNEKLIEMLKSDIDCITVDIGKVKEYY